MTPKKSALVLTIVAVPIVVASVIFLPVGGVVSLLAALGLAVGVAAAGLSLVWWQRTSWGAEPRPVTRPRDHREAQRRSRAALRTQGYVGLGVGLIGVVIALAWGSEAIRLGGFSLFALALGVASLVIARSSSRPVSEEEARDGEAERPHGWIRVGGADRTSVLVFAVPVLGAAVWGAWQVLPMVFLVARQGPLLLAALFGLIAVGIVVVLIGGVRRMFREIWIEPDEALVRLGREEIAASSLTAAHILSTNLLLGGSRSLFVVLEAPDKVRIPLLLRRRGRLAMTAPERLAVLALIEASSIALPRAKEDPTGKFSRLLFPAHLDAEQARDLVARPPRSDEDLPVHAG